ncbi:MAG: hypothetical protein WC319_04410 [Candidatus Paceibacterota bacterium]|jgi:hypothetical protein
MAKTMNNYLYQQFAGNVELMPIRSIVLQQFDPDDKDISVYNVNLAINNLEAESNFKITPITKNTFWGQVKTLCYRVDATVYIPYNEYQTNNLRTIFENVLIYDYLMFFYLGKAEPTISGYNPPDPINSTAGMIINFYRNGYNPSHTIEIESVEYRPRMILRISQLLPDIRNITILNS